MRILSQDIGVSWFSFLQANARITPSFGHNCSFPNSFLFITQEWCHRWMVMTFRYCGHYKRNHGKIWVVDTFNSWFVENKFNLTFPVSHLQYFISLHSVTCKQFDQTEYHLNTVNGFITDFMIYLPGCESKIASTCYRGHVTVISKK
jgi:hypothetical protein